MKRYDCDVECISHEAVSEVKSEMPDDSQIEQISNLFKIFGDPTRLKILKAISIRELCVCDLAHLLDMSHSAISHQLMLLRRSNLVKHRKQGKIVYYTVSDSHVLEVIKKGCEHKSDK